MDCVLAYFDPGAGSLLMQMLLGGVGGLLVAARYVWTEIVIRRSRRDAPVSASR